MKSGRLFALIFVPLLFPLGLQQKPKESAVLAGEVLDSEERPIEGALVIAIPLTGMNAKTPSSTSTDGEGRFRLELENTMPHRVQVDAEGFALWLNKRVQRGKTMKVILDRGALLEGRVLDGYSLEPIAGATVEVFRPDRGRSPLPSQPRLGILEAETDEEGHFQVEGVGRALHAVAASAMGYGRAVRSSIHAGSFTELFLFSGSSISGNVLGPDDEPVEGAIVQLETRSRGNFYPSRSAQITDSRGAYSVLGVEAGQHRLIVRHRELAPTVVPDLMVRKDENLEIEVFMWQGTTVLGRLLNEEEKPVLGRVSLEVLDGGPTSRLLSELQAESRGDGYFSLGPLPPGSHALSLEANGYAAKRIEVALGEEEEPYDLGDIVLETGLAIRGQVVDERELPIAGARVSAVGRARMTDEAGQVRLFNATTDSGGAFVLAGLYQGPFGVTVRALGYATATQERIEAGTSDLTIIVETGGTISGEVVDRERRPVKYYRASARPTKRRSRSSGYDNVSNPSGAFVLRDLAAGIYVVEINAPELRPEILSEVEVESGRDTYVGRIHLMEGGSVRGYVLDPSGVPLPGAAVHATGAGSRFGQSIGSMTTDGKGFFEIRGLPDGKINLMASHSEYAQGRVDGVTVDSQSGPAEAEIVLSTGGAIEGWVRARDGRGMAGHLVHFNPEPRDGVPDFSFYRNYAETEPDGHFRLEGVPAGRGQVSVASPSGVMATGIGAKDVEIVEGETAFVEFDLRRVLVHGQVTSGGAPASNLEIVLYPRNGGRSVMFTGRPGSTSSPVSGPQVNRARTRKDGTYELFVEQPGEFHVSSTRPDGSHLPSRTTEVPDTETFVLDLDFGGTPVFGTVMDEETENPVAGASVIASPAEPGPGASSASAMTGPDGSFQVEIEPGEYKLHADAEGYGRVTKELSVGSTSPPDIVIGLPVGLTISGRVLDEMGRGVRDINVTGSRSDEKPLAGFARTMADGSFLMGHLVAKPYNLFAASTGGAFAFLPGVRPGRQDAVLNLQPGGRVSIQAFDMEGQPVEGASVNLSGVGGVRTIGFLWVQTDVHGQAEVAVPAGPIELILRKSDLETKLNVNVPQGGATAVEAYLTPREPTRD